MDTFLALQWMFSAYFRNGDVNSSSEFVERKHLWVWTAEGSANSSNYGEGFQWPVCPPVGAITPARAGTAADQPALQLTGELPPRAVSRQAELCWTSTSPAPSGGDVLGMTNRITPRLLPEGGAVADEKLFSSQGQSWKRISVHTVRLSTGWW